MWLQSIRFIHITAIALDKKIYTLWKQLVSGVSATKSFMHRQKCRSTLGDTDRPLKWTGVHHVDSSFKEARKWLTRWATVPQRAYTISRTVWAVGAFILIWTAKMPNRMIWIVAPAAYLHSSNAFGQAVNLKGVPSYTEQWVWQCLLYAKAKWKCLNTL